MRTRPQAHALAARLRKLGWWTLLAFTAKGVLTTSLIVWAFVAGTGP
jgi:hypothetical protein